ncbi:MAG: methyltransferase domain-containing protein [Actinomycetota bacterium]
MASPTLSIVIPVWAGEHNLPRLIPSLAAAVDSLELDREVVVAGGPEGTHLRELSTALGASFVASSEGGYGEILREGLRRARGRYVVTLDADFSHRPGYIRTMWHHRHRGEVLLGSRYVPGAHAELQLVRRVASRLLNFVYRTMLSLPYRDLSSGFRLYHRRVLEDIGLPTSGGLDVLPEMAVKALCQGWKIAEVPIWYRGAGPWTRTRMVRLGFGYLRSLGRLFALRNSVRAADYDDRAFDSWIPLQRYWQRRRFRIVSDFVAEAGRVLDIGCGSSRIVQMLAQGVGVDVASRKLRWLRGPGRHLAQADMNHLPFPDASFDAVICSEVIEHVPREQVRLEELARVVRPGGLLVLGTPDYGRRLWRVLEWTYGRVFPGGYAKEHINRYTHDGLERQLREELGLEVLECRYVGRSEMIFKARVPATRGSRAPATTAA